MTYFSNYSSDGLYDEMFNSDGSPRPAVQLLVERINNFEEGEFIRRQITAEYALLRMGITFNVYADEQGVEKIFPFDLIPRIIDAKEWEWIERGLKQRIHALNLFIDDVYHEQKILKDGIIPQEVVYSSDRFLEQCIGLDPPRGIWCHITGTDLVRDGDGQIYVLEDNLGCPSGVSYVVENRQLMKRTFPQLFGMYQIQPVEDYPSHLLDMLQYIVSDRVITPEVALLTPGIYNSAYFEHSFLAQQMGVELVEGRDLVVMDGYLHMRTTKGFQRVDVLYRRINDDYLDPDVFNPESLLGVPGLMDVYKSGRLALINAPGTCVADDKVVCAYVPQIIKYYLNEDIIVPNVPTYMCWEDDDRKYVLEHIHELVVKEANQSGGYGMLIGPHSTKAECEDFVQRIKQNPRNYIAQPTLSLSRVPVLIDDHFEGRHVDLRPFILYGEDIYVLPGGLTRVALKKGSLVVNSSQGGGSKDTWVLSNTI